uniref:Uncharacterized protein n=1 Tax=Timema monikensis TaxID=170555 RepID=A0A7R9EJK0_9NEOP|nr:unnamed protein product [Timema monikensis]
MDITQSRKSLILWPYSSGLAGRKRGASFNMTPLALPSAERRCGSQLHFASRVTPNHRTDGDHWTAVPSTRKEVYPLVSEGRVKNNLGKSTLSTPDRDSSLALPVISSLVHCESSALDHKATEADHVWWTCVSVLMADVTVNRSQHTLTNAKGQE